MDEMELLMKELRVSAWEDSRSIPKDRIVSDQFGYKENSHERFMIIDKRPLSI